MALSEREQRLLAEMEAALSADDPGLVQTLNGGRRSGPGVVIGAVALIVGIATLFAGLIAQLTAVGVSGFIFALVGVVILINALSAQVASALRPSKGPKRARRSFTQGFEDRWEQRGNS
jgi:hypothetical protein